MASGISDAVVDTVLHQAQAVGALANDTASSALAALVDGGDVAAATAALVPTEVDMVIPQADMTILAPGPLAPELQSVIESFTELESSGLASVFRVTESSVRAAFDAGRTPDELVSWLAEHTPGEVPQPMEFLIRDAARGYGQLRVGEALSFVRADDPSVVSQAVSSLSNILTLIAPQVAVANIPLTQLVARLREAGLHPAAEDNEGVSLSLAPEPTLVTATPSTLPKTSRVDEAHIEAAVAAIRQADTETAGTDDADVDQAGDADHIAVLQAAARGGKSVAIGYVNKNGQGKQINVTPLSVSAGQVDVLNEKTGAVVRIALPRITRVILQ
ncbi:helicase-associated domain-containing protein [Corynebacterium pilosum]|uniref:helicase-associated domain-containing protein n=1 Tax=Corynebacterium pilosum TaxID=35756 RepID=UPI001F204132|nr:helicase-associated domain-containing protein [Corynebacterium pilosum]